MITLEEFLTAFIGFLPLYFALVIVPSIISHLVLTYTVRTGLVATSLTKRLMDAGKAPVTGEATRFAMTVVVAPFAEELIFRGIPLLIHPVLAWIGTIGWALAHGSIVASEVQASAIGSSKAVLAGIAQALYFISAGIFYMLIWSLGFDYGAVAITYHALHNLLVFLAEGRISLRRGEKKQPAARPAPTMPIPLIRPARPGPTSARSQTRRVLRDESTGTSLYLPAPDRLIAKRFKEEQ